MKIAGTVLKYGDHINTDLIIPGKFLHYQDSDILVAHTLCEVDAHFQAKAKTHHILAAGTDFGCGSSREQAALCLKYAGIQAIIARSVARIFFRNAINLGIAIVESPVVYDSIRQGSFVEIDLSKGTIQVDPKTKPLFFTPLPPILQRIIESKGLVAYLNTLQGTDIHE